MVNLETNHQYGRPGGISRNGKDPDLQEPGQTGPRPDRASLPRVRRGLDPPVRPVPGVPAPGRGRNDALVDRQGAGFCRPHGTAFVGAASLRSPGPGEKQRGPGRGDRCSQEKRADAPPLRGILPRRHRHVRPGNDHPRRQPPVHHGLQAGREGGRGAFPLRGVPRDPGALEGNPPALPGGSGGKGRRGPLHQGGRQHGLGPLGNPPLVRVRGRDRRDRPLLGGHHGAHAGPGGNPHPQRGAGETRRRTDGPAGGRQQGAGGLFLLRVARPEGPP